MRYFIANKYLRREWVISLQININVVNEKSLIAN